MELNYFDLVAGAIILLLGLKGVINGFFKELFGLIGIIGGISVASRVGDEVGQTLNNLIFKFENEAAVSFTGFLATLAVFWILMTILGLIFKKLSSVSGLGPIDRILGFLFGASKFFLIASVIANSAYNMKAIKSTIDSSMKTSVLFPILVETGGYIMKLEPIELNQDANSTINKQTKSMEQNIQKTTQDIVESTKKKLEDDIEKTTKSIIEDTRKKLEESMKKQMGEQ